MTALYSVAEILAATGGRAVHVTTDNISSISIDSREIGPGALFVAIQGDRFDGHDFVAKAIENGAVAALVSAEHTDKFPNLPIIIVPDALAGLVALARTARARSTAKIIAVTGSAGKTTTKEAIRVICEAAGKTHASIKSFNNHWGVPLMLARMPRDTSFGVFEVGMSAAGEISTLTGMLRPDIAVITTIAAAHLENFGSLDAIALAKAEIFEPMKDGTAIINGDHNQLSVLLSAAESAGLACVETYGFAEGMDLRIVDVAQTETGMTGRLEGVVGTPVISIASAGRHRLANAVGAYAAARAAGISADKALTALSDLKEPEGRGALVRLGPPEKPLLLIDESYNANPASMVAALDVFKGTKSFGGKRVLVLGDMLELGPQSQQLHEDLAEFVLSSGFNKAFLVGNHMGHLAKKLGDTPSINAFPTASACAPEVLKTLDYGDLVMVKASNSMQLNAIVAGIRERFSAA